VAIDEYETGRLIWQPASGIGVDENVSNFLSHDVRNLERMMLKSEIKPGTDYAVRERRTRGTPFQRVRIIEHVRGNKWKAKWIDPNPGLIDYIESGQLIVSWKGHKAFLKQEASEAQLREHNTRHGYTHKNSPVITALEQVFESVGDGVGFRDGSVVGSPEAIARLRARAKMVGGKESFVTYVDCAGELHLPFDEAFELGRRFCAAEPSTVLVEVEVTERTWTHKATHGEEYILELLNEYRASWALLRQWAGYDAAVAQREEEIKKLERLVWDAIYALQKTGHDSEAAKLRRGIEKH
jgi:hypothetical protein